MKKTKRAAKGIDIPQIIRFEYGKPAGLGADSL